MSERHPVTQADLNAYVDGQLTPQRRAEVEAHLAADPRAAAQVDAYRQIDEALVRLYADVDREPVPEHLLPAARPRRSWRAAAAIAWLLLGTGLGWQSHRLADNQPVHEQRLIADLGRPAVFAHALYAAEVRHPVEVPASEQAHLTAWLSRRMATPIHAPDLTRHGFALIGGRLLPSAGQMAGQFMYESPNGQRITLYARRGTWSNRQTAFRFANQDGMAVFFWIDGSLGYALVGDMSRAELLPLAHAVHGQLSEADAP